MGRRPADAPAEERRLAHAHAISNDHFKRHFFVVFYIFLIVFFLFDCYIVRVLVRVNLRMTECAAKLC